MSARVSVSAPAASSAAMADGRAGSGAGTRAASFLDTAGHASAADNTDSGANDSASGAGSRAGPFAAALASATRGGPGSAADTSGAHSEATPSSTAGAEAARAGASVGEQAAQSAGAQQSDAAQSADTTQTLGQVPSAGTLITLSAASAPSAAAAAAAAAAASAAATATATASQSAGPASGAQAGSADVEDPSSTDGTAPSTEAHGGSAGRSSARSDGTDGSAGTAWCALALLQTAAASLAVPCQPADASAAGATTEQQDQADGQTIGGAVTVLAGGIAGGASLPATPSSTGATATSPANASTAAKLVAAQTVSNVLPGMSALSANGVTGGAPGIAHGGSDVADARGQSSAAARAASWMPQFLATVPAAAGSDGVARAISTPMSDPSWPQALAAQVHWMAGSQVQSATLTLSPQHLGPIQVRIDLQQSQINVNFSAAHADTRAALADAMPRLREMLAAGGLSLGQANVQQQSAGHGSAAPPSSPVMRSAAETVDPVAVGVTRALGLVDEYV